ncbi:MAG TPA: multicopper oxidase domain-containing protein [Microbacteriaceae bacterium]|nr:multicopper oxidase domain-containing protein [Microbacteriaceae bacterium]
MSDDKAARTTGRSADGNARRAWYRRVDSLVLAWALAAAVAGVIPWRGQATAWLSVHLVLLGAATAAIMIWSQYFADTLIHRAGDGRRGLAARLALHTPGTLAVIVGVPFGLWPLVVAGAAAVAVAIVWHVAALYLRVRSTTTRFSIVLRYYVVAGLMLVVGICLGVVMAGADAGQAAHGRLLLAHVAFNVAGWVGLSVLGTVVLLWPAILHTRIEQSADQAARRALPVGALGILVVGAASLTGIRLLGSVGLLLYLAAVLLVLRECARQAKATPPTSYAGWAMGTALLWFAGCIAALAVAVFVAGWPGIETVIAALLVPFVVGFVAQLISGALSHLIPVTVGGGAASVRRMNAALDAQGAFRVIVVNGALVVALFPLPRLVHVVVVVVAVATLVAVIPLAVVAIRNSRRTDAPVAPRSAEERRATITLHSLSGSMFAAVGVLVLAVAVGVSFSGEASFSTTGPGIIASSQGGSAASTAAEIKPTGKTTRVEMTMKDLRFWPSTVKVPAGNKLVIHVTNKDDMVHDLTLATGQSSGRLVGGKSATVDVGVVTANINGWCSIPGHRQLGMVMKIVAEGAAATKGGSHAGTTDHSSGGMAMAMGSGQGKSAASDIDLAKNPPASFTARDPQLPARTGKVHHITLTVRDVKTQVAPGITQDLWTYNGTAPAPIIQGKVGDRFDITLINHGDMGHGIDFHAGELSPNGPMRTINPGQKLTFSFTAEHSGIWLYHCSTMPMSQHIANGMYGAVIIDPPGMDKVSKQFVFIQSEYYLGPQGGIADPKRIATQNPDLVVFNGYADQYKYRPITVKAGQRVRIWVLDAGPNVPADFHVVGTQFPTVFKEGNYLIQNGGVTKTGASQALGLMPAQGGFVELTFPAPGDYTFISHIMSDAEKGAMGVFHAVK